MSTPVFDITKVSKPLKSTPTEPTEPTPEWEKILDAYCFILDPASYLSSE